MGVSCAPALRVRHQIWARRWRLGWEGMHPRTTGHEVRRSAHLQAFKLVPLTANAAPHEEGAGGVGSERGRFPAQESGRNHAGNGAHAVGGEAIVRSCQSCTWAICLGILACPRRAHTRTVERGETPVERGGYEPILGRSRTTPALRAPRGLRTANLPPQAAGEISRCQQLASTAGKVGCKSMCVA